MTEKGRVQIKSLGQYEKKHFRVLLNCFNSPIKSQWESLDRPVAADLPGKIV